MIDFDRWATKKAAASQESEVDWKDRLHQYSQKGVLAQLTDGELEKFLENVRSVAQLDRLQKSFTEEPQVLDRVFKSCDSSPFDFGDWLDAYDYFLSWLNAQSHRAEPNVMLGYINCCVEYAKGKPQLETLTDMLKDMLSTHGFDGKLPQLRDE